MKYTAQTAKMIFGQEMIPCPKCGGFQIKWQTPIKMEEPAEFTAKSLLRAWARSTGELKGPVYLMCWDCGHKGPEMDCSGRTSSDVGKDPLVAKKVKLLWNSQ